ncbi:MULTISPECIES: GGDEF domain-containing protein [Listeria]|uniref:GGDEF domain-containing protein n=1 Tax=Listeria TaxID=1637 RepID=UPI000B589BAC|nr:MULTISPECIES: GGDEF domain-containing protein [Listeria]
MDIWNISKVVSYAFANVSVVVFAYFLLARLMKFQFEGAPTWSIRIISSLFGGLFGFILMNFSIIVEGSRTLNLIWVFILLNAYYFGGVSAFLTSMFTSFERLLFGESEIAVIFMFVYLGIGIAQLIAAPLIRKKTNFVQLYIIFSITIVPLVVSGLLIAPQISFQVIIEIMIYILLGVFTYFYIVTDLTALGKKMNFFERTSKIDFLTKIENRYMFTTKLESLFGHKKFYLFLLDINHFKKINDVYGHDIGDLALKLFAEKLDELYPRHAYRLGGDEFAVIVASDALFNPENVTRQLKKEMATIQVELPNDEFIHFSTSVGYVNSFAADSLEKLYRIADKALYKDKANKF